MIPFIRPINNSDGAISKKCIKSLAPYVGSNKILLTPSCTSALELAYLTLGLKPGFEVIMPSFTFPSTANAPMLFGGKPKFIDIRPDTLNMDADLIEDAITKKTKVISPVHYAGVLCEMRKIGIHAIYNNLFIVEDSAQSLGSKYKWLLPRYSDFKAFSFHYTKNVSCGEGGALVVMNKSHFRDAEIIRQKGTDRSAFLRKEVDKYSWKKVGSSYIMSEIQCSYLWYELDEMPNNQYKRQMKYEEYLYELKRVAQKGYIQLPTIPSDCQSNYHIFWLLTSDNKTRDKLIQYLKKCGIQATSHYYPLHLSEMGQSLGYKKGKFPVTERVADTIVRLPIYPELKERDQAMIIKTIKEFYGVR